MIDIDFPTYIPEVLRQFFSDETMESVLSDVADGARAHWIKLARSNLSSSKDEYVKSIQAVQAEAGVRTISLVGWLANRVERGLDPYDMHETLLRNTRSGTAAGVKISKDGFRYRAIPFRHGSAGSAGRVGAPMGSAYGPHGDDSRAIGGPEGTMSLHAAVALGKSVHAAAKQLKPGQRLPAGTGQAPKLHERHTTDIYAGMQRVRHTYAKATQSSYKTFRMISERVPEKWHHPGIEARDLSDQVGMWIRDNAAKFIQATLTAMLKGYANG